MEKKTVLIIYSTPDAGKLLKWALEDETGHEGIVASSAHEALEFMHSHKADLVILDKKLPDLDGFEMLHIIRTLLPEIPIAMVGSCWDSNDTIRAAHCGVDEFMVKPLDIFKLRRGFLTGLL